MNKPGLPQWIAIGLLAALLLVRFGVVQVNLPTLPDWLPVPEVVAPPTNKALVVILYEKDSGSLSSYAIAAITKLRSEKREVIETDIDQDNGTGQPSALIRPAIEPARKAGLPALVLVSGGKAIKAIPLPESEAGILEACR